MKETINNERKSRLLILSTYLFEQYPRHIWDMHGIKMEKENIKQYSDLFSEKWKSIDRLSEEYAKVAGLTPMALTVLSIICDNEQDCTQKLICKQSQFNKQSVNMIIKSFLELGYVELAERKEDRRNKQIKLSEKGKNYADKVIGFLWKIEEDALTKITPVQRKALIVFLDVYEQCFCNGITSLKDVIALNNK